MPWIDHREVAEEERLWSGSYLVPLTGVSPGVVGALDSCTVSKVGAPLAPLLGAFPAGAPARASGSSGVSGFFGKGVLDVEMGVEF